MNAIKIEYMYEYHLSVSVSKMHGVIFISDTCKADFLCSFW